MKISTKGRYAIEAVLDIALHQVDGPVNLRGLSERCEISEAYVLQIFTPLRKAKIIKSIRGAQGGYLINLPLEKVTVGDILIAVEGPLAPVDCIVSPDSPCDRFEDCTTKPLWEAIMTTLTDLAFEITLDALVKAFNKVDHQSVTSNFVI